MSTSDLAAWVQAVGSILAIIAAFIVPAVQRWLERRDSLADRKRQAIGIGTVVMTELFVLETELDRLDLCRKVDDFGIDIPAMFDHHVSEFWLLGQTGEKLLYLLSAMRGHNRLVAASRDTSKTVWTADEHREAVANMRLHIQHIKEQCEDARAVYAAEFA